MRKLAKRKAGDFSPFGERTCDHFARIFTPTELAEIKHFAATYGEASEADTAKPAPAKRASKQPVIIPFNGAMRKTARAV